MAAKRQARTKGALRRIKFLQDNPVRPGDPRVRLTGKLLIIGGHEDKLEGKLILRELARLTGSGKLVVATLASEQPSESWERYENILRDLGVRHLSHLRVETREDGASPRALSALRDASAVFFTGGDQVRLTSLFGDTPAFSRCAEILSRGGTIAGTSAGAAVMSEIMIVSANDEQSHRIGSPLLLAPGFGFFKDVIVDQHFAERGRIGRLLGVVAQNPRVLGLGIDENTAIEVRPGRDFLVMGEGAVYVVDGAHITHTNVALEEKKRATAMYDVCLHVLTQSDRFDLRTRTPQARAAEEVERMLGDGNGEDSGKDDSPDDANGNGKQPDNG
jgi:cyanophycinase